jgi:hypothetical protein
MAGKIFINYRRGDDPGNTGRLFDRLQEAFRPEELFMDVDSIKPGLDFVKVLEEQVSQCDILLAVIGHNWIDLRDQSGARRLDDPEDFVRIEIAAALAQGKRVIPVLVGEARMPRSNELPEPIKPLARRQAVRLTHERFRADMQGVVRALQEALDEADALRRAKAETARQVAANSEDGQAVRTARTDEPSTGEQRGALLPAKSPPASRRLMLIGGALAAGIAGVLAVGIAVLRPLGPGGVLTVSGPDLLTFTGPQGGPFSPDKMSLTLRAIGPGFHWSLESTIPQWLSVSPSQADMGADAVAEVTVALATDAQSLPAGQQYNGQLSFRNHSGNTTVVRAVSLVVQERAPAPTAPARKESTPPDRMPAPAPKPTVALPQTSIIVPAPKSPTTSQNPLNQKGRAVSGEEYQIIREVAMEDCSRKCTESGKCQMFSYWNSRTCYLFDRNFGTYETPSAEVGFPKRSR